MINHNLTIKEFDPMSPGNLDFAAYDFEQITVGVAAIGPTAAKVEGGGRPALRLLVTTETNSIRYRVDGTDPTATVGHLVAAPGSFEVTNPQDIRRFKMIRASADATVNITFERE